MASFFLFSFAVFASFRFSCVVRRSLPCPSDLGARCRQVCLRKKREARLQRRHLLIAPLFFVVLIVLLCSCREENDVARAVHALLVFFFLLLLLPLVCCTTTPACSAACVLSSRCRLQSAVCYQTSSIASSASSFPVRCTVARS